MDISVCRWRRTEKEIRHMWSMHKHRKRKHLRARMWRDNRTDKKSEGRKREYCTEMSVSSNCSIFLSSLCTPGKTDSSKLSSTVMRTLVVYGRSVSPQVRVFATCYVCNILHFSPVEMWWYTVTHGRGSKGKTGEWNGYPVPFTLPRNTV